MNLRDMLLRDEGYRTVAYRDSLGFVTIGVGHLAPELHVGDVWTDAQVDEALDADIIKAQTKCQAAFPWFDGLNDARQAVIVAMAFQLGMGGLLKFVNTLKAVEEGRYDDAAEGMRNSVWARQTPLRAIRMAEQMQDGQWVTT